MATEFEIQGLSRVCGATGRELRVGERYYTVLTDEQGKFVRKDYSEEAWTGPSPGMMAFWAGRVPAQTKAQKPKFNDELLLDCFHHLAGTDDPNRRNFRYVVALLLMRRKRLKFEDVKQAADGSHVLVVRDAKSGARQEIPDPRLSEDEIAAVQNEVFHVLGWE